MSTFELFIFNLFFTIKMTSNSLYEYEFKNRVARINYTMNQIKHYTDYNDEYFHGGYDLSREKDIKHWYIILNEQIGKLNRKDIYESILEEASKALKPKITDDKCV